MLEMHDGIEVPIGLGAAKLYDELEEMVERARKQVRLTSCSNIPPEQEREALLTILRKFAPRRYIEPHPGRHTHCGCAPGNTKDLTDAVCLQNKLAESGKSDNARPDYAFASDEDCLRCRHCSAFSENVAVLNDRLTRSTIAAEKAPSEETRVATQAKLAALKAGLANAKTAVRGRGRK
jgi:hypothetical protein